MWRIHFEVLSFGEKQGSATYPQISNGSLMFWTDIMLHGCITLHEFERRTVPGMSYRNAVLELCKGFSGVKLFLISF